MGDGRDRRHRSRQWIFREPQRGSRASGVAAGPPVAAKALAITVGQADATADDHDGRINRSCRVPKKAGHHVDRTIENRRCPASIGGGCKNGRRVDGMAERHGRVGRTGRLPASRAGRQTPPGVRPTEPATPPRPVSSSPMTAPPPMPVETVTKTRSRPAPAPKRYSPQAAAWASLCSVTGRPAVRQRLAQWITQGYR